MAKRKNNNKKNRKNRLFLLILLLSLSILLLVMSTYAWFTSNTTVAVESLDVNVTTVNGLQISADAVNWKAKVLKNDISGATSNYAAAKNFLPDTLDNVSTVGAVSNGFMDMYHGTVTPNDDGSYALYTTKVDEAGRTGSCTGDGECSGIYFIAFDLFFKVDADTNVVLVGLNSGVTPWSSEADTGIKNTVRVAFVKEGHVGVGATAAEAQALKQTLTAGSNDVIIWEPNYDTHTAAGVANASSVYGITTSQSGGDGLAYKGVKAPFDRTVGVKINTTGDAAFSQYFANVTPTIRTAYGETNDQTFASLEAGVTKYRVYWWVEGQDVDTENGATGKHMTLNLSFAKSN